MRGKPLAGKAFLAATLIMFYLGGLPFASAQPTEWAMTLGGADYDEGWVPLQAADGDFIVVGDTGSFGAGGYDVWVVKISPAGDVRWQKTYGTEEGETPLGADLTSDRGIVIAGITTLPGRTDYELFVLKLNAQGEVQWYRTYGGDRDDWAMCIEQTSDGGYIVGGATHSFGATLRDFWVLKLDGDGDIMWQKRYGGGDVERRVENIHQTADGGYILAGTSESFPPGETWVLKLDGDGDIMWQYVYGPGGDVEDIQVTMDGGYVVLAEKADDAWILKLDADGGIQWQRRYGYPVPPGGDPNDFCEDVQPIRQTSDGGYVIAGSTTSFAIGGGGDEDLWVLKVNAVGDIQWQRRYGGAASEEAYSLTQTSDNGYMVVGETESFGLGGMDVFLLKLDSMGRVRDCPLVGPSEATSTDTNDVRTATDGVAVETSADVRTLDVAVMDTDAEPAVVCVAAPPPPPPTYSYPVGGVLTPASRIRVLAPFLALIGLAATVAVIVRNRKR